MAIKSDRQEFGHRDEGVGARPRTPTEALKVASEEMGLSSWAMS